MQQYVAQQSDDNQLLDDLHTRLLIMTSLN